MRRTRPSLAATVCHRPFRRFATIVTLLGPAAVLVSCGPRDVEAPIALADVPSRFVEYDGLRVHWKSVGRGDPALLFVPGWAGDMRVWREQTMRPPTAGRMIFIDLPGHGQSDAPEREYPFDWLAGAIEAVRVAAGEDRLVVAGHSNGAAVALCYLRAHPEAVSALISAEGSLRPLMSEPRMWEMLVSRFQREDYEQSVAQMLSPDLDEALRAELLEIMMSTPQHVMVATLLAFGDPATWTTEPIEVPVLALHAPSRFWTDDYKAFVRTLAPRLDWRERPGVGHYLMLEEPDWFAESILGFLGTMEEQP